MMGIERSCPYEQKIDQWLVRVAIALICLFMGGVIACAALVWG